LTWCFANWVCNSFRIRSRLSAKCTASSFRQACRTWAYSSIERTPGANALAWALDSLLGPTASQIKRDEHSFSAPEELRDRLIAAGFDKVEVRTVVQHIAFPSVLDYVSFQLVATPMAAVLGDRPEGDRQAAIKMLASETTRLSDPAMLEGGRFSFQQEGYVRPPLEVDDVSSSRGKREACPKIRLLKTGQSVEVIQIEAVFVFSEKLLDGPPKSLRIIRPFHPHVRGGSRSPRSAGWNAIDVIGRRMTCDMKADGEGVWF